MYRDNIVVSSCIEDGEDSVLTFGKGRGYNPVKVEIRGREQLVAVRDLINQVLNEEGIQ